jgi:hypothetical protein
MKPDPNVMSCEQFQSQLADLIGAGVDLNNHPHLQQCDTCLQLLRDLETIAEAARQLFPIQQPEDNLWERIETAIRKEEGMIEQE